MTNDEKIAQWEALYRRMRNIAAGYSNQCDDNGTTRRLGREFDETEKDARNLASNLTQERK